MSSHTETLEAVHSAIQRLLEKIEQEITNEQVQRVMPHYVD